MKQSSSLGIPAFLHALLTTVAWLLLWPLPISGCSSPLGFDTAKLQQFMQVQYGSRGVQALDSWLGMLNQGAKQSEQLQLQTVNTFWNEIMLSSSDSVVWGEIDHWATPLESLGKRAGDCEDFVIGKYFSLIRLGMPAEKLRLIYVRAHQSGLGSSTAHMVLGFYETPDADPLILDSLMGDTLPASQRQDLTPVFSFNKLGIYVTGANQTPPVERISRWRGLVERMRKEGFMP
ncbi:transglutaminase-like cysteine peptidase [Comamonas composti]|uniref:transglutaminase-like cysteine peptidase n=1 Tax=Comamonas composti TaxID=408558 RepID=UPI00047AAD43|nr:transglutaminase-like cysteine peptidase [Comamonas composti]